MRTRARKRFPHIIISVVGSGSLFVTFIQQNSSQKKIIDRFWIFICYFYPTKFITEKKNNRQTDRQTDRDRDRETETERQRQTGRDRQADRLTDRRTNEH